jgi:hypothetical protein
MDSVTRQKAITELCKFARDNPNRQFIFITPQSVRGVIPGPDLKILEMQDPRTRDGNQRTLDETFTNNNAAANDHDDNMDADDE